MFAVPAHQDSVFRLNKAIHDAVKAGYRDDASIPVTLGYITEIQDLRRRASARSVGDLCDPAYQSLIYFLFRVPTVLVLVLMIVSPLRVIILLPRSLLVGQFPVILHLMRFVLFFS